MKKKLICFLAVAAVTITTARGTPIQIFTTPVGTNNGGAPVNARVTTQNLGGGFEQVTIENLVVDASSVASNPSVVWLTFNTGQNSGTISSSSTTSRIVNGNGTYTDTSSANAGWVLLGIPGGLEICDIGCGGSIGPAGTILGPPGAGNKYTGGGSIVGNPSHNPFDGLAATFILSVTGLPENSSVSSVRLLTGTNAEGQIFTLTGGGVPEPGTLLTLSAGLAAFGIFRARKLKQQQ